VTGVAVFWRAHKYAALVAALALGDGVCAVQRESGRGVIKPIRFCRNLLHLRHFRRDFCLRLRMRN
jgi:hypothetical protein